MTAFADLCVMAQLELQFLDNGAANAATRRQYGHGEETPRYSKKRRRRFGAAQRAGLLSSGFLKPALRCLAAVKGAGGRFSQFRATGILSVKTPRGSPIILKSPRRNVL